MRRLPLDDLIAALAASQHAAFSHVQALDRGATEAMVRWRVATGQWRMVVPGVYVIAGSSATWHQRLSVAVLEGGPGAVASHSSAAALLRVPGFGERELEVTRWRGTNHRVALSRLHETSWLPPEHRTEIDGIPCTTLARCLFDLAGTQRPARVERALDNSLSQLGLRLERVEEVVAVLGRRGRPGSALMRRLVAARGDAAYVPSESELEALLFRVLDAHGVERPVRQLHAYGGERPVGRVDCAYPGERILIEAQSERHHRQVLAWEADLARMAEAAAGGWALIPVTWSQLVHEPDVFVSRVRQARAAHRRPQPAVSAVAITT